MRSNRSGYTYTPAGSAKVLDKKPKPKRPKKEINQIFLLLFFIILPVLLLLAVFIDALRWVFIALTVIGLLGMWVSGAFLFPR